MPAPLARSYLFVPANRPERFDKAYGAGADAVIVDLEDAVPEAEKATARAALANWLSADKPVLIRINHAESTWFADDLEVCRMDGCAGVVLPKAERVEHIAQVAERTGVGRVVIPLLETAQGLYDAVALARAPRVERLAFGSIDFQVDLGIRGENEELLYFRSHLVLASRLGGVRSPIDGVTTAIDDANLLREEAQRARRLGFGAKLCIHPKQLPVVSECFSPSAEEVAWAKRVRRRRRRGPGRGRRARRQDGRPAGDPQSAGDHGDRRGALTPRGSRTGFSGSRRRGGPRGKVSAHTRYPIGLERMVGAGALGDQLLLERNAVALEQVHDPGEQSAPDQDGERGGGDGCGNVRAGEGGLGVHGGFLAVRFRSGYVRCC